jgi:hypothetical protein
MSKINYGRVILAGLVAGLVINVVDFVVNVPILGKQWAAATAALGVKVGDVNGQAAAGWITMDFIVGLFTAWLYAAIRPRYGAGARTGSLTWQGLYPLSLNAISAAGALVAMLAGGWTAGRLYTEAG